MKYLIPIFAMVAMSTIAFFISKSLLHRRKIRTALTQAGFGYSEETEKNGRKSKRMVVKWKNKKTKVVFTKFNYGLSTHDFTTKQKSLEEIFGCEFVRFDRKGFKVIGHKADYSFKKIDPTKVLIGTDGVKNVYLADGETTAFVFGLTGSGKTTFLKSLIKQFRQKENATELIITAKTADFDEAYSYSDPDSLTEFIQKLQEIEDQRLVWEKEKYQNKDAILIICDEAQFLEENKDLSKLVQNFIRTGRSQKIFTLLSTQSASSSLFKAFNINLIQLKISVRGTESLAQAETLFPSELAKKSFYDEIPHGFGFCKSPSFKGGKVKFYYEQI